MNASVLEQASHGAAMRLPLERVAGQLQLALGQRLVAAIAGVSSPKAVGQWARGERTPYPEAERRLRDAYQVAELLLRYESPSTARAWFEGMNPELAGEPPALALAARPAEVLLAAKAFLADAL